MIPHRSAFLCALSKQERGDSLNPVPFPKAEVQNTRCLGAKGEGKLPQAPTHGAKYTF